MSRRSFTSAVVVPTNAEEIDEHESDQEEEDCVVVVESDEQLDMALEGHSSRWAAGDEVEATPPARVESDTLMSESHLRADAAPSHRCFTESNNRLVQTTAGGGGDAKLVKNYRALASSFKYLKPFTRGPDGTYPAKTVCVLCASIKPTSVFFPCQHMCVCNKCIDSNDMSPTFSLSLERCVCPVCRDEICLILPHTGNEEERYWNWVLETEPPVSSEFKIGFKSIARRLSDSSVVVNKALAAFSNENTRPLPAELKKRILAGGLTIARWRRKSHPSN